MESPLVGAGGSTRTVLPALANTLLLPPFLKPPLNGKSSHDGIQDETADASALSFGSGSDPFRFLMGTANEQHRAVWVPLSF